MDAPNFESMTISTYYFFEILSENIVCDFIFINYSNEETSSRHCSKFKRYAMIVHGYQESCNTFWVKELRKSKKLFNYIFITDNKIIIKLLCIQFRFD